MAEERSECLVLVGWIVTAMLYLGQAVLFVSFLAVHTEDDDYQLWIFVFVPAVFFTIIFLRRNWDLKYANEDKKIWFVWIIWAIYIVQYVISVAVIFCKVARKPTHSDLLGPNALKSTLCITPALLILFLQLVICPSYRKPVLSLSVFAALNIFDGIEMLEIVLMQNERNDFNLNVVLEKIIVAFACCCFLISPLGLVRNKFCPNGEVKERETTSKVLGPIELIGSNLPFLVLRSVVWGLYKYEASVFIAKNVISLVIGAIEFLILKKVLKCGD